MRLGPALLEGEAEGREGVVGKAGDHVDAGVAVDERGEVLLVVGHGVLDLDRAVVEPDGRGSAVEVVDQLLELVGHLLAALGTGIPPSIAPIPAASSRYWAAALAT